MTRGPQVTCAVCQEHFSLTDVIPSRFVRPRIAELITANHLDAVGDVFLAHRDLNHYRSLNVTELGGKR